MTEQIEELRKEIEKLRTVLIERERRVARIENEVVELKKSMERIVMLVDGNAEYNIFGVLEKLEKLQVEVNKLLQQKEQMKWAVIGILIVTSLGNASSIMSLAKMILFP